MENSVCEQCETWKEEMYWKQFNSMHFCQTLTSEFQDHLVLPEKFASQMKAQLPDKVSLKGPSGALWEIELVKSDGLLFTGNEWIDFVKANNLKENCLLIFKYTRSSSFEVLIFDQGTSCEKEETYFVKKCRHTEINHEVQRKRTAREISSPENVEDDAEEDCTFVQSKKSRKDDEAVVGSRGKVNVQTSRKRVLYARAKCRARVRRAAQPQKLSRKKSIRNETANEPSEISERNVITLENGETSPDKDHSPTSKPKTSKKSVRFQIPNEPSEISERDVITPENGETSPDKDHSPTSELQSKRSLNTDVAAKHLSQNSRREPIIPEGGENSPVADHSSTLKAQFEKQPTRNDSPNETSQISEWDMFITENGESPRTTDYLHKLKAQSEKRPSGICSTTETVQIVEELCSPENEKEPTENGTAKVMTQASGRQVIRPDYRECSPEDQYRKFYEKRSQSKKQGLPQSAKKLVFKSVSGKQKFAQEYMSNRRQVTEMEKEDALERANQKKTENSFTSIMRPTCVYKRFFLNIPSKWLQKHHLRSNQDVILRLGEKTWLAKFCNYGPRSSGLNVGWKTFSLENSLEEFDVLVFKLVSQKDEVVAVFDVDIFRVVQTIAPLLPITP